MKGKGKKGEAVLIAGPTASGKSALARRLAQERGGMIINADSMQVYAELSILTARPSPAEEAELPHRLYGHVGAERRYSAGAWLADISAVLAEARLAGLVPIIVGGTGLYFKALTEGIALVPPIPASIREAVAGEAAALPSPILHQKLAVLDPEGAAHIRPSDPSRIVRALEVVRATGRPLHLWQSEASAPLVDLSLCQTLVLDPPREALYRGIEARVELMLAQGALREVTALARLGLDEKLPAMRAIGVHPLLEHLAGRMSLEAAGDAIKLETRHYAKRQATWFRHQTPHWTRILDLD